MSNTKSGGLGFFGVLQVVFIVLKVTHLINWSWFWVFSPFFINLALVALLFLVIAVNALR